MTAHLLTLDDLNNEAETAYRAVEIPFEFGEDGEPTATVVFRPLMRCPKALRQKVGKVFEDHLAAAKDFQERTEAAIKAGEPTPDASSLKDGAELNREVLTMVAEDDKVAKRFFAKVGDRSDIIVTLWKTWNKVTSPGEASTSES